MNNLTDIEADELCKPSRSPEDELPFEPYVTSFDPIEELVMSVVGELPPVGLKNFLEQQRREVITDPLTTAAIIVSLGRIPAYDLFICLKEPRKHARNLAEMLGSNIESALFTEVNLFDLISKIIADMPSLAGVPEEEEPGEYDDGLMCFDGSSISSCYQDYSDAMRYMLLMVTPYEQKLF